MIFVKVAFYAKKGKQMLIQLLIAIIGSTAIATLVQFFVNRYDSKKNIADKLTKLEKDGLRCQLLLLILLRPGETQEILTISEHYFKKLKGDWYMTSIFNKWVDESGIAEPEWFKGDEK